MFFLPQALFIWLLAIRLIDWQKLPELLVYGLWAVTVGHVEDHLGYRFGWWRYQDTGLFPGHYDVSGIVFTLSAPLLVAMYFVQGLRRDAPVPWGRVAAFTAFAMIPEIVAVRTGHIVYGHGWSELISVGAYLPTWLSLWWLHRWIGRHRASA